MGRRVFYNEAARECRGPAPKSGRAGTRDVAAAPSDRAGAATPGRAVVDASAWSRVGARQTRSPVGRHCPASKYQYFQDQGDCRPRRAGREPPGSRRRGDAAGRRWRLPPVPPRPRRADVVRDQGPQARRSTTASSRRGCRVSGVVIGPAMRGAAPNHRALSGGERNERSCAAPPRRVVAPVPRAETPRRRGTPAMIIVARAGG